MALMLAATFVRRQLKRRSASARLLREHADQIGLNPAFTIHDREDSADRMNLIKHELGFSRCTVVSRSPWKMMAGTVCPTGPA
jgi:hypothetical protein